MLSRKKIRSGIIFSLILAIVVMTAIALYGDLPQMITVLARFRWEFLPLILGLTLYNYFWRFIKWQYYLRRLQIGVDWRKSLLIFISGLSMAITPGKVGELLKCYLLKRSTGEPISRTSPIVMSERLTDGIAMLGLSVTGLILYRYGIELLLVFLGIIFIGLMIIQNRSIALALIGYGEKLPFLFRIAHLIRSFYESSYILLRWRPLLLAILIGLISWSGECGALYFVFAGLGLGFGFDLFLKATFILAFSSLVGSATGLPGGLGTADGSMIGLMRLLVSASATIGGAATLLIRLCTLWFGLGLGVVALIIFRSIKGSDIREGDMLAPLRLTGDVAASSKPKGEEALPREEERREEQKVDDTGTVHTDGRLADSDTASALLNIGESFMKTLLIIPTYNEVENLPPLLNEIFQYAPETDILIVDDNSPDGTGKLADKISEENTKVHVLHRAGKLGLGTAYIAGFKYAVAHDYEAAFEMDADFSHDPRYLPDFLRAIENADLVIGSRYVPGGGTPNWSPVRRFISGGGNIFARLMLGIPVHDCTAGYRCYRRQVLENIDLDTIQSQGYAFQVEMAYRTWKQGFKIVETPIIFKDRRVGKSKMSRKIVIEGFTYVIRTRLGISKKSAGVSASFVDSKGQDDQPEGGHFSRYQKGESLQDDQAKESPSVVQK